MVEVVYSVPPISETAMNLAWEYHKTGSTSYGLDALIECARTIDEALAGQVATDDQAILIKMILEASDEKLAQMMLFVEGS